MSGSKNVIGFGLLQAMVWTMSERLQQERAENAEDSGVVLLMRTRCPFNVVQACRLVMAKVSVVSKNRLKPYSVFVHLRCA